MAEMGETLRPDFALLAPPAATPQGKPQLLIASLPGRTGARQARHRQALEGHPRHPHDGAASRGGVPLGLVTNGEQWMLVYRPAG